MGCERDEAEVQAREKLKGHRRWVFFTPPPFTMSNAIRWYKSTEMDAAELNSPQPCKRGIHCNYMVKNDVDEWEPGCCRGVHPGEEGTGRRIFPARSLDGKDQPACVRLTGKAGYYERRRLRLSWSQWCEREGIPFTPATKEFEPVTLVSFSKSESKATDHSFAPQLDPRMMSRGFLGMPGGSGGASASPAKLNKNQRHQRNKREALLRASVHAARTVVEGQPLAQQIAAAEAAAAAADAAFISQRGRKLPSCQAYEGMSCAYGGFGGCVNCLISCEELEAGLLDAARRPSNIDLRSDTVRDSFAVRGRGGECSPDCCCPTGFSCHDRTIPDDTSGCGSPMLTSIVTSNEEFESLD